MNRAKTALVLVVIFSAICPLASLPGVSNRVRAQQIDTIELEPLLSGLSSPVFVTNAGDNSNRLFIVEQPGRIKVLQPGTDAPTVFLNITARVLSGGERGLLGLAFHPQYASNRRFFVNYTRAGDGATVIAEYRASANNANVADTAETVILVIPQPFANHNGGMIEFGPDGFLYIGMGDGGSANDPGNRAQNVNELLGKMLRINIDQAGTAPYTSPADNPFFGSTPGRDEIYAVGLRNPFRWSFDRLTGQLYAGDVGQGAREEIDIITLGGNYGWRVFEGTVCTNLGPQACNAVQVVPPIAEYSHAGGRCSVTGGYVYRGSMNTLPSGAYLFADFCTGEIFVLQNNQMRLLLDTNLSISSFGEDESGELYVVNLGGSVHRVINSDSPPPPPPGELVITGATITHRVKLNILAPVTVRNNGKKYEIVVRGRGFVAGSVILINGREMNNTQLRQTPTEIPVLVARLRQGTLSEPGTLTIEVVNPDGSRSNQLTIEVTE